VTISLLGFILFSKAVFAQIIRRNWRIQLAIGIAAATAALAIALSTGSLDLQAPPRTAVDVLFWILIAVDSWCWTLFFLFVGMRYLDRTNKYLAYGQEAILPSSFSTSRSSLSWPTLPFSGRRAWSLSSCSS